MCFLEVTSLLALSNLFRNDELPVLTDNDELIVWSYCTYSLVAQPFLYGA